ncbi:MAG: glycosyltransferase family 39 protein [Nitrososphaerota archaeon]|nr:glycosyltransferase family 39 protein [Nitrososphaerota archaeon]
MIALFTFPLSIRISFWILNFSQQVNLAIYDLEYYVDNSILLTTSISSGNLDIVKQLLFHPLLGFYTTSVSSLVFGNLLDKYHAGLLSPIIFSSLICLIVYLIGEKIGGFKVGIAAWLLATLDPYSIQFSTTFLDMPATFFSTLFFYLLLEGHYTKSLKKLILLGIVAGLAFSSKHIVIPSIGLLILLLMRSYRKIVMIALTAVLTYLFLNIFKFTSLEYVTLMVTLNISGGAIGIPAIIYGPIEIGKPYTYPWYVLTYLGLGYTGFRVAPFVVPLLCLIFYAKFKVKERADFNNSEYTLLVYWVATSLIPLILLPRNYWTVEVLYFAGKAVQSDVFMKFFYPYYHIVTVPSLSVLTSYFILRSNRSSIRCCSYSDLVLTKGSIFARRIFEVLITIFLILSPLAFLSNTVFPFWDFLFVLTINIENYKEPVLMDMGLHSLIVLTALMVTTLLISIILNWRKHF